MFKRIISVLSVFLIFSQNTFAIGVWYVDSVADDDLDTCTISEAVDDDNCTLRDAISQAVSGDSIRFLITSPNKFTDLDPILLTSGLTITQNTLAIGSDNEGGDGSATTTVVIDGAGGAFDGITVSGDDFVMEDVTIVGFDNALVIEATSDNSGIANVDLGTKSDGSTVPTNRNNTGALIKGTNFSFNNGNNISHNSLNGIEVEDTVKDLYIGGTDITNNLGNGVKYVGTGTASFNGGDGGFVEGILVAQGFPGNVPVVISGNSGDAVAFNTGTINNSTFKIMGATIGSSGSANTGDGIDITTAGTGNTVLVGTDGDLSGDSTEVNTIEYNANGVVIGNGVSTLTVAGNTIQNNTGSGVTVNGTGFTTVTVGGDISDERNNIGNGATGITVTDAGTTPAAVTIQGNYIGFTSDGATAAALTGIAVSVADGAVVTISSNSIGNAGDTAVSVTGGTSLIFNSNNVGVDATAILAAGVVGYGLHINAPTLTSVAIGTGAAAGANVFAAASGATGTGLYIQTLAATTTPVTVQGNYFGIGSDGETTSSLGNGLRGARFSYGAIALGGDNGLGALGTGTLDEGNVISNNTLGECVLVDTANVTSFTAIGNVMGLKKGAISGVYDTAAGNGDASIDSCLSIDASALTTLVIGQGSGVGASTATSRRNIISSNTGTGILVNDVDPTATTTIQNNYVGLDYLGVSDLGNAATGIYIGDGGSGAVTVGGTSGSQGNMISGNGSVLNDVALDFSGAETFTANVYDNYIGLNAAGTAAIANAGTGIIASGANITVNVGGGATNEGNVISGNTGSGIDISNGIVNVEGNTIGLNAAGTSAVANGAGIMVASVLNYGGIMVSGGTVVIGTDLDASTDLAERNYISGNAGFGIGVIGGTALTIAGNYIGLNAAGTAAVPNSDGSDTLAALNGAGIAIYDYTGLSVDGTIIGTSSTDTDDITNGRNYISGNAGAGISILHGGGTGQDWAAGYIKNNYIGTNTSGAIASGFENTDYSIVADSDSSATITGLSVGGTTGGNTLNNTDHLAVRIDDLTLSNAATMATDNTYTDATTGPTYNYWGYYVANTLTDWDPVYACNDGVDNDGDGQTDYSQDDGCSSATDNDETDPVSGGGGAVAISLSSPASTSTSTTITKSKALALAAEQVVSPLAPAPVVPVVPVVTPEDIQIQKTSLEKAVSNFVDTFKGDVVNVKAVSPDAVKQANADWVADQVDAEKASAEKSVESKVVEKTINKVLENVDNKLTAIEIKQVSEAIQTKTTESLTKAVAKAAATGDGVTVHIGGGQTLTITNLANVQIVSTFGMSATEKKSVEEQRIKAESEGKQLLVIDETSDLAGDGVSDIYKTAMGLPIFGANELDDDGVGVSDEVWIGLNPLEKDGLPQKPIASVGRVGAFNTNVSGPVRSGKKLFVRIGGQPGDVVKVTAVESNNTENQVDLGTVTIDESGKAELRSDKNLDVGKTYIILVEGNAGFGKGDMVMIVKNTSSITISKGGLAGGLTPTLNPKGGLTPTLDPKGGLTPTLKKFKAAYNSLLESLDTMSASVLSYNKNRKSKKYRSPGIAPSLEKTKTNPKGGLTPTLKTKIKKKYTFSSILENLNSLMASVLAASVDKVQDKVDETLVEAFAPPTEFVGEAEPGTIIVVTWKSVILSSVVVADASQGKFVLNVPKDIPDGNHEVMVFAYNPSKKSVSTLSTLKFKK